MKQYSRLADRKEGSLGLVTEKNLPDSLIDQGFFEDFLEAMHKIKIGTYGICENCQNPIPKTRMEAMPEAIRCIECQLLVEEEAFSGSKYLPLVHTID